MSDFDEATIAPNPAAEFPVLEPKRIMVFGVLHIVFGGLGLIQILFSVVTMAFQERIMKLSSTGAPEGTFELQMEMTEKLSTYSWIVLGISGILSALILKAGIGLVRKQAAAVAASNLYAWTSIGMKVVMLILYFVFVLPVYNEMFKGLVDSSMPAAETMLTTMRITAAVSGVVAPMLGAIYPILALTMLNKPIVRDFFTVKGQ